MSNTIVLRVPRESRLPRLRETRLQYGLGRDGEILTVLRGGGGVEVLRVVLSGLKKHLVY